MPKSQVLDLIAFVAPFLAAICVLSIVIFLAIIISCLDKETKKNG